MQRKELTVCPPRHWRLSSAQRGPARDPLRGEGGGAGQRGVPAAAAAAANNAKARMLSGSTVLLKPLVSSQCRRGLNIVYVDILARN